MKNSKNDTLNGVNAPCNATDSPYYVLTLPWRYLGVFSKLQHLNIESNAFKDYSLKANYEKEVNRDVRDSL